jgi:hypothetical protein
VTGVARAPLLFSLWCRVRPTTLAGLGVLYSVPGCQQWSLSSNHPRSPPGAAAQEMPAAFEEEAPLEEMANPLALQDADDDVEAAAGDEPASPSGPTKLENWEGFKTWQIDIKAVRVIYRPPQPACPSVPWPAVGSHPGGRSAAYCRRLSRWRRARRRCRRARGSASSLCSCCATLPC